MEGRVPARVTDLEVRLDVLVGDRNPPDNLAQAMNGRVLVLSRRNLAEPFSHRREVHVGGRQVPPAREVEPRILLLESVARQQGAPDCGPCELDFVFWPCVVTDDLFMLDLGN